MGLWRRWQARMLRKECERRKQQYRESVQLYFRDDPVAEMLRRRLRSAVQWRIAWRRRKGETCWRDRMQYPEYVSNHLLISQTMERLEDEYSFWRSRLRRQYGPF